MLEQIPDFIDIDDKSTKIFITALQKAMDDEMKMQDRIELGRLQWRLREGGLVGMTDFIVSIARALDDKMDYEDRRELMKTQTLLLENLNERRKKIGGLD